MSMALLRDLYGRQLPDYVSMSPATGTSLGQLRDAVTALSEEVDSHFMVSTADAANRERRMEREMAVFAPVTVMTRSLYLLSYVALLATILLSVTQRRHEFKTLRALGFHRRDLVRLMVTEAGFVALVGVAEGMILGIVLGKALFFVMPLVVGVRLESHLGLGGVAASAALVTLVAVLAALGPAARVTRHHAVAR